MPAIDKRLPELRVYQGSNPCPRDFDDYWNTSLTEMRALDSAVELRPSEDLRSRAADCFDLWFKGVGGARVHAKYLRPRNGGGRHPAVLQFHGSGGSSGEWNDKFGYVSQGFCVAALDCRGQGGLSEDVGGVRGGTHRGHLTRGLDEADPKKLLLRSLFLDAAQLAGIVMAFPEVDEARVAATGLSQGGGLTLACAALEPRIRKAAPIFPFLCDYRRAWELDLGAEGYGELRLYLRYFDPTHERAMDIFTKLGYVDCQHLAARIKAEVLMFTALSDAACPPSTQFAAYNKIGAKKAMVVYPDFGHEGLPGSGDRIFAFLSDL